MKQSFNQLTINVKTCSPILILKFGLCLANTCFAGVVLESWNWCLRMWFYQTVIFHAWFDLEGEVKWLINKLIKLFAHKQSTKYWMGYANLFETYLTDLFGKVVFFRVQMIHFLAPFLRSVQFTYVLHTVCMRKVRVLPIFANVLRGLPESKKTKHP